MVKLAPSILAADFSILGKQIKELDVSGGDYIHIDVMDGNFVPNISFGVPIIQSIRPLTDKPFDVHLMVESPGRYIEDFVKAGADIITVHYEADKHIDRTINLIKQLGKKVGIALNPGTPIYVLQNLLTEIDMVLIMTVNPGFGGQSFIPYSMNKITELKSLANNLGANIDIQVDGGIDSNNIGAITKAGANVIVAGSSVFKDGKICENIFKIKEAIK
jgi:ribulose-phosphate 3-epimerase